MERRPALAVFLVAQALYLATASGWPWRAPDEFEVYFQTESLVERGSLALTPEQFARLQGGEQSFFGKHGTYDGKLYAPYGPFVAVCAAPFHVLARLLTSDPFARAGLTTLASATAGALAVAGFFRAARRRTDEKRALALSAALAVSVLWPYSKCFFSEAFSAAALIWAYVLVEERRVPWAALLLGVACLLKVTNAVFAVPLALAGEKRQWLILGPVLAGLVHMEWNTSRFGHFSDFGYAWSETIRGEPRPFGGPLLRGLAVLLVSPGKSIFVWAPAILLALPHMKKERAILATSLVGLFAFAKYMFPEGGYCHGPRHLVPIVALLLLPAAHGFSKRGLLVLALLGASLNLLAACVSYLEDQALGEGFLRQVYYAMDPEAPEGLPRNVYRLDYLPQVTLVRTLEGSSGGPGMGLDLFWNYVGGAVGFVPLGLALVSGALGFLSLGRPLLRDEKAAILPARAP